MRPINTPPSPTDTSVPSDERSSLEPGSPAVFATTLPGRRAGGQDDGLDAFGPDAGPWVLEGQVSYADDVAEVPCGDAYELDLDPDRVVDAKIFGQVEHDGAYPVSVAAYTHGGQLIGQAISDADGHFVIPGVARSGMRLVAQTSGAALSAYDIGREILADEPWHINVLTSLVDRLRIATAWRHTQAEQRMQDFLGIARHDAVQISGSFHPGFSLKAFMAAQQQTGLDMDGYINQVVSAARQEPHATGALSFAREAQSFGEAGRPDRRAGQVLAAGVDPQEAAKFFLSKILSLLDGALSDEEKEELFGGLLVKLGIFSTTSPMEKMIAQLAEQVAVIVGDVNALLKKLNNAELNRVVSPVNDIIRACFSISNDLKALQGYTSEADYAIRSAVIREQIQSKLGDTPYTITQLFIGYPGQLGVGNTVMDALMQTIQCSEVTHFYGYPAQAVFQRYMASLRAFQAYILTLKVMRMLSLKYQEREQIDETYLLELCRAAVQYDKVFEQISVTALPHDKLYIDLRTGYGWWADASLAKYYGTWRDKDDLQHAESRLPEAVRQFGSRPWEVPQRADIETPFFKESQRRALSFKSYIIGFGGPADGFYDVSEIESAPKFNFWLDDTFQSHTVINPDQRRPPITVLSSQRAYARPSTNERDFRKTNGSNCIIGQGSCGWEQDFGNYGGAGNYFYPVNKHVVKPEQYYPWVTFAAVREKYKNFDHVTIMTAS